MDLIELNKELVEELVEELVKELIEELIEGLVKEFVLVNELDFTNKLAVSLLYFYSKGTTYKYHNLLDQLFTKYNFFTHPIIIYNKNSKEAISKLSPKFINLINKSYENIILIRKSIENTKFQNNDFFSVKYITMAYIIAISKKSYSYPLESYFNSGSLDILKLNDFNLNFNLSNLSKLNNSINSFNILNRMKLMFIENLNKSNDLNSFELNYYRILALKLEDLNEIDETNCKFDKQINTRNELDALKLLYNRIVELEEKLLLPQSDINFVLFVIDNAPQNSLEYILAKITIKYYEVIQNAKSNIKNLWLNYLN